jgi:hypothetical protein
MKHLFTRKRPLANKLVLQANILIGTGIIGILLSLGIAASRPEGQFPWNMAGGYGTMDSPYMIETCEQLQRMGDAPASHYALAADIDCTISKSWNDGAGFFPVGTYGYGFGGTLDGRNHTIYNLYIARPATDYIGLFGKLDHGSVVRRLEVYTTILGRQYVGGIVGWTIGGRIEHVRVNGTVQGFNGVGGIAGVHQSSIDDAVVAAQIIGTKQWVGGIVGWNYTDAELSHAYMLGDVSGYSHVGGIAGVSHAASITESFVGGHVTGSRLAGGLIGHAIGSIGTNQTIRHTRFSGTLHGAAKPEIGKETQE